MSIRRYYVPGATVFLTQVVYGRQPIFQHPQHLNLLRGENNLPPVIIYFSWTWLPHLSGSCAGSQIQLYL